MKVVHLINALALGGSERQLVELTRRSSLEHEVLELDGLERGRLGLPRDLPRLARGTRAELLAAWLERPQIAAAVLRRWIDLPLVACLRGLPSPARTGPSRTVYRLALTRFELLIANSEAVKTAAEAFVRPLHLAPVLVIPNGAAASTLRAPQLRHPLRVAFIGRAADPDKGFDILLAALGTLGREVEAVLLGEGVPEAVRRAGLEERHAALPASANAWDEIGDVDVLVVPSRREGSPNVVLEAFARGVPVVGTAVGGLAELLAHGRGLAVPAEDPAGLAGALRQVARDPEGARARAATAWSYVRDVHSWPRVVAAYDAAFASLSRRP